MKGVQRAMSVDGLRRCTTEAWLLLSAWLLWPHVSIIGCSSIRPAQGHRGRPSRRTGNASRDAGQRDQISSNNHGHVRIEEAASLTLVLRCAFREE